MTFRNTGRVVWPCREEYGRQVPAPKQSSSDNASRRPPVVILAPAKLCSEAQILSIGILPSASKSLQERGTSSYSSTTVRF